MQPSFVSTLLHVSMFLYDRVQVDSLWEDCSFRIESLNILLFMVEGLDVAIQRIHKKLSMEIVDLDEVRQDIGVVLDSFGETLDQDLPPLPDQCITCLDKLMYKRRVQEWEAVKLDMGNLRFNLGKSVEDLITDLEDFMLRLKALAVEVGVGVAS